MKLYTRVRGNVARIAGMGDTGPACADLIESCEAARVDRAIRRLEAQIRTLEARVTGLREISSDLQRQIQEERRNCPNCEMLAAMRPREPGWADYLMGGLQILAPVGMGIAGMVHQGNMMDAYGGMYSNYLQQCAQVGVPCQSPGMMGGGMGGFGYGGMGGGMGGVGFGGGMMGPFGGGMGFGGGMMNPYGGMGGIGLYGGMGGGMMNPYGGMGGGWGMPSYPMGWGWNSPLAMYGGAVGGGMGMGMGGGYMNPMSNPQYYSMMQASMQQQQQQMQMAQLQMQNQMTAQQQVYEAQMRLQQTVMGMYSGGYMGGGMYGMGGMGSSFGSGAPGRTF
ncbi:MAG: hypothetical protein IT285_01930 [Bdellovibrionales bacterium]|nr:hypothetical protein [Bdellovibrionales bacterium]